MRWPSPRQGISSTEIKLTWNDLDSAGCYRLFEAGVATDTGNPNDHDSDGDIWDQIDLDDATGGAQDTAGTTYTHGGLTKGEQRWYQINSYEELNGTCQTIIGDASGITVLGQTKDEVGRLAEPLNLVAEVAKDSSGEDDSTRGVLLQWLKPLEADGFDDPEGYAIQVSTDDGLNWEFVTGNSGNSDTIYRHASPLPSDEQRIYRVRSASSDTSILSDWSNESHYPPRTSPPGTAAVGAPGSVVADGGSGTISVMWTPGSNADGHLIIVAQGTTLVDFAVALSTETSAEFEDLDAGEYRVIVVAFAGSGDDLDYDHDDDDATVN